MACINYTDPLPSVFAHTATCLCVFTLMWSEHCDEILTRKSWACVQPYHKHVMEREPERLSGCCLTSPFAFGLCGGFS